MAGIYEHMTQFAGKPVADWDPASGITDPTGTLYRISLSYEEAEEGWHWTDQFAAFLNDPLAGAVTGLIVGAWEEVGMETDSQPIVEALVAASPRLPDLNALFLGDIVVEESEISWIRQSDVSPLFAAYPQLEQFGVRGSENLSLGTPRHDRLRSLTVQSGGLPARIVREIVSADLPELEHLELWLGAEGYGGDASLADLEPYPTRWNTLLGAKAAPAGGPYPTSQLFPKLRSLGLRDSEKADEIAVAVATAPILKRVRVLDLSLGTLTDDGAAALLASPAVARLEKLDIHHHFCSESMVEKLQALGIVVDAGERQQPEAHRGETSRYVAVGE